MKTPDAPLGTGITPSCTTCPNRIPLGGAEAVLGRSVNADVCLVKGYLLATPTMNPKNREKLHEAKARGCSSFGKPRPTQPRNTFQVGMPIADRIKNTEEKVPSCRQCVNFISERDVLKRWGWNGGYCAARGELVVSNKLTTTARNCSNGEFGSSTADIGDVKLFDEYFTALNGETSTLDLMLKGLEIPDPLNYETDEPVTDEHRAAGIGAWRKIYSTEDANRFISLPVFAPAFFTEAEQATIPRPGDDEHPELYVDHDGLVYTMAALWRGLGETPALWGMPGVGKTELTRYLAYLMQVPFTRLSINAGTELDEIAGKMLFTPDKGTYFQLGRLPKAYTRPGVVCLDEPNTGPVDVWQFIRPLTDNSKQLVLDMDDGKRLTKHQYCYLALAMNPAWDVKNVGALQIGAADGSRLMHVSVDLPPESIERQIIQARVKADGWEIPKRQLDAIMAIAKDIRALCNEDTLPMTWGIREQIKVARASRFYPFKTVYRIAAGDYLDPEARQALTNAVNSHIS